MSKVLLLGANGLVGVHVVKELEDRDLKPYTLTGDLNRPTQELIDDFEAKFLISDDYTTIINCAAFNGRSRCDADPKTAYTVNVRAPRFLSYVCNVYGMRLVHLSTNAVLADEWDPQDEFAHPLPSSLYGLTRLLGEREVAKAEDHAILRIARPYGLHNDNGLGLQLIVGKLTTAHHSAVVYAGHVAEALVSLAIDSDFRGVVHYPSERSASVTLAEINEALGSGDTYLPIGGHNVQGALSSRMGKVCQVSMVDGNSTEFLAEVARGRGLKQ